MTRIIKLNDTKPLIIVSRNGKPVWVCRCGLSEQWPYCDSSHIAASGEDETTLYEYVRERAGAWPTRSACRVVPATGAPEASSDIRPANAEHSSATPEATP